MSAPDDALSRRPPPVATLFTDRDGVVREANDRAHLVLDRPRGDLAGLPLSVVLHDADRWLARLRSWADRAAGPFQVDARWIVPGRAPASRPAWVEAVAGGERLRWLLPDLRTPAAESDERHAREQFQVLIDAVPCTLSWVSSDLRYLLVNRQVAALIGETPDEFVGKEVGFRGGSPFFLDFVRSVFRSPGSRTTGEVSIDANGDRRDFLLIGSRYAEDREATIIGLDITDRKRTEETLRATNEQLAAANARSAEALALLEQARDQAEAASRAKDRFLANMSHEMLTPLNGVLGIADLLLERPGTNGAQDLLQTLRTSAAELQVLIRDVLAVASPPAAGAVDGTGPVDVRRTVEVAAEGFRTRAHGKGLRLETRVAPEVPRLVRGAPDLLRQLLEKLLDNAVKFTAEGQVLLFVSSKDAEPGRVELAFSVEDTGIGVDPAQHQTIFDPFVQADGSNTRPYGGAGLGLAVASRLAARLGGTLSVESPRPPPRPAGGGPGSVFRFTAAMAVVRDDDEGASSAVAGPLARDRALHVLVAEDNPVNRLVARHQLEDEGHRVTVAEDGVQAVAACRRESFDAVLMDIQMPGLDGFQALAAIRAGEAGDHRGRVPVIALTAHALPGYGDRCLAAGMDGFLTKPLRREALGAALHRATGTAGDVPTAQAAEPHPFTGDARFDREASLALAGGDEGFLSELARVFREDCPRLLGAVRQAAADGDPEKLRQAAHALKGAIAAFAAPRAWHAARAVEELSGRGDPAGARTAVATLETEVGELCTLLAPFIGEAPGDPIGETAR